MKKIRNFIAFLLILILLTSCGKSEKIKLNDKTTLKGTITTSEITKDNETKKISILNLDKPIIIDGTSINKIELEYDKDLKDNTETSITGTIKNNEEGNANIKYSIEVDDIENALSYINTFSNDKFSITIPANLMKIVTDKKIDDGFIIYSSKNMEYGGEACRFIAMKSQDFKNLTKDNSNYEKVKSDKDLTIIIKYPTDNEYADQYFDEYEQIMDSIISIKNSVRIK